jgi:septum formation protein
LTDKPNLLLASTSRYRAELLARLKIPFTAVSPEVDESPLANESCHAIALRLAIAKAHAGAKKSGLTNGLVIGSDQVAELNGKALGKPGTTERAFEQLSAMRGQTVVFHTGLALLNIATSRIQSICVPTTVTMREYASSEIQYYLNNENALDCAGSAKSEALGAALIAKMTSDDPTALIGLPLLELTTMLSNEGYKVLS